MALLEKNLIVKRSTLPGAGKGLFTKVFIPKGTRIVEYKGEIVTWKEVEAMADDRNGYVFFFNNRYCIDAWKTKKGVAHVKNNSEYVTEKKHCYIEATRDIPAGSEILVGYGAEYWQAIRYNIRLEQKRSERAIKKADKIVLPHHHAAKRTTPRK